MAESIGVNISAHYQTFSIEEKTIKIERIDINRLISMHPFSCIAGRY